MSTDIREQLTDALSSRYAVDRLIGSGGMATVYLARDLRHDRQVALKVLNPELGAVLGSERFLSEIKVTANLQHPNLLPLFDSGDAEGLLFYVMPYVEGESLRARLDREKQLPVDEAVRIAVAVASALDYAHRHGVIHRDLKPENILLHEGQPVIADFGIALAVQSAGTKRMTQTGLSLGTPEYMSPEQALGDAAIDSRTDICARCGALRDAGWRASVHRSNGPGDSRKNHHGKGSVADAPARLGSCERGCGRRCGDCQAPGRSIRDGRRLWCSLDECSVRARQHCGYANV